MMNTCGHEAPRFTDAPRCHHCGAYAHEAGDTVYKVPPRKWWLLEWLTRRSVRAEVPPQLSGHVTRS